MGLGCLSSSSILVRLWTFSPPTSTSSLLLSSSASSVQVTKFIFSSVAPLRGGRGWDHGQAQMPGCFLLLLLFLLNCSQKVLIYSKCNTFIQLYCFLFNCVCVCVGGVFVCFFSHYFCRKKQSNLTKQYQPLILFIYYISIKKVCLKCIYYLLF